ncbi:DUF3822 family protein [Psychroflexus tropicus]|uniref:DUF3822 family protein n=1 Tax=Psychroflexus tropicus TaxID=197345 RepID=UPI0003643B90|nr:DUF3822 family protein [Psychroflexus tropicus]
MSESSTYTTNRLSILILQDGFSFLISNSFLAPIEFEQLRVKTAQSATELLKQLKTKINAEFIKEKEISELQVIYANPQFSIVPEAYFDESYLPHYIKYSSKLIEGDDFSFDPISSINANTVYIPYVNINNYLFDIFGSFEFTHILTGLIQKALSKSKDHHEYIQVHLGDQYLYLTAFRDQHLILANAFHYDTSEDLCYYILFCSEELNMDRESLELNFTGDFVNTKENAALQILLSYVKHISFSNFEDFKAFNQLKGFKEHFNSLPA